MSKWTARFLDLADHVATWSKDPRTQVRSKIQEQIMTELWDDADNWYK